jgi:hypothetical protein
VAYVRQQQIRKGDKTYRYYQLVRGYRENGKVKIEVLKHLGKYDSIEAARRAAESVVTKEEVPEYVGRLNAIRDELGAERLLYIDAQEEFFGAGGSREEWQATDASQRNLAKKKRLHKKGLKIYDSLSQDEQDWVMWEGRMEHGWHFLFEAQGARERAQIFGLDY